jgi:hypothetical protein
MPRLTRLLLLLLQLSNHNNAPILEKFFWQNTSGTNQKPAQYLRLERA